VEAAVDVNTKSAEQGVSWLGEKLDELRLAVVECNERVNMEGSHIQDRLNEVKAILDTLPMNIAGEMG
jgi:uncharacterized membrane protein